MEDKIVTATLITFACLFLLVLISGAIYYREWRLIVVPVVAFIVLGVFLTLIGIFWVWIFCGK